MNNWWHSYIIIKLLTYASIPDSTHKILMDCGKFHVMHDVMLLCLQEEVNASDIAILLMYREQKAYC